MALSPPPGSQPPRSPLGFDDVIGIVIAFLTIGSILFWTLGRAVGRLDGLDWGTDPDTTAVAPLLLPTPSPQARPPVTDPQTLRRQDPRRPFVPFAAPGAVVPVPLPATDPTPDEDTTAAEETPTPSFIDVSSDFWAYPFIIGLAERGVVRGFAGGYYRPEQPVTRAEFAAMVQAAFDPEGQRQAQDFEDLEADFWAVPAIDQAYRSGFMEGYPGNIFRPTQEIPRVQILVALASGLNLQPTAQPEQVLQIYQDAEEIPNYATEQVTAATESGLVVNYPETETLNPNQNATRADAAAWIYQALVEAGQAEPIESQYQVQPAQ